MTSTAIWAVFLPPVKESLYFHKRKKVDDTSMAQSTVTIYNPEKYKAPHQLSVESLKVEQVFTKHNYRYIYMKIKSSLCFYIILDVF